MKGKIWAKTILQAYNYVNRIIRSIDKMVVERSAASHHSFGYADTLRVAEEIMALIERKRHLICMKHLVEDSLQFMEPGSNQIFKQLKKFGIDVKEVENDEGNKQ